MPRIKSAFGIFLLRQYYQGIPRELDEAAMLRRELPGYLVAIILPLSALGWRRSASSPSCSLERFSAALVVINDPNMRTVQLGLPCSGPLWTQWTLLMAGTVTVTLPADRLPVRAAVVHSSVAQSGVKASTMGEHWSAPGWHASGSLPDFPERFFNGDPANDPPNRALGQPANLRKLFRRRPAGIRAKLGYLEQLGIGVVSDAVFPGVHQSPTTSDYLQSISRRDAG